MQKCEALHMICLRIQHGMESNMGYLDHQFSHYSAKYAWLKFCTRFVAVQGGSIHFSHFSSFFGKLQRDFIKILSGNKPLRAILLGFPSSSRIFFCSQKIFDNNSVYLNYRFGNLLKKPACF